MSPFLVSALVAFSRNAPMATGLTALKLKLDTICKAFHGKMGYYVKMLKSGVRIQYGGDERFPTASTIKTATVLEAVREIDAGKLKWYSPPVGYERFLPTGGGMGD